MVRARMAEPEYTNGRIRVRPEQIEYLDALLHATWITRSRERNGLKARLDEPDNLISSARGNELIRLMNREMRLIKTIQDEVRRTKGDMGLE